MSQKFIDRTVEIEDGILLHYIEAYEGDSHFICYENLTKFNALVDAFLS